MKTWQWLAIGAGAMALIGVFNRKEIMEAVWDIYTERRIARLHPSIQDRARQFIHAAEKEGIKLRITDGYRTFDEQQEIYNKGRTAESIAKGEKIVTNAKPGQSFHNYALAFDVVEIKDGKGLWENPNWPRIGALGKSFGFAWGGDFSGAWDKPHFEYPPGVKYSTLLAQYNAGQKDAAGYLLNIT